MECLSFKQNQSGEVVVLVEVGGKSGCVIQLWRKHAAVVPHLTSIIWLSSKLESTGWLMVQHFLCVTQSSVWFFSFQRWKSLHKIQAFMEIATNPFFGIVSMGLNNNYQAQPWVKISEHICTINCTGVSISWTWRCDLFSEGRVFHTWGSAGITKDYEEHTSQLLSSS